MADRFETVHPGDAVAGLGGIVGGMLSIVVATRVSKHTEADVALREAQLNEEIHGINSQRTDLSHLSQHDKLIVEGFINSQISERTTAVQGLVDHSPHSPNAGTVVGEAVLAALIGAAVTSYASRKIRYALFRHRQSKRHVSASGVVTEMRPHTKNRDSKQPQDYNKLCPERTVVDIRDYTTRRDRKQSLRLDRPL